jgi:hydrophobic/amphiphilic exporter-1 (mainly G- bacteria), HAE1 family
MIRIAVRRPVAVSMAYAALALLGVAAWRGIPLELLPDTQLPRLEIHAELPGASPEAMEARLTAVLEAQVRQVRGVARVGSVSELRRGDGGATIQVEFARGTDMEFARLELSERLAAIRDELPPRTRGPRIEQYVPREFQEQNRPFLRYTVTGPHTLEALRAHLDDVVAPELRQVAGVGAVIAMGGRARLLEVELLEDRMLALGLDPRQVQQRIRELDDVQEAGVVESRGIARTMAIRHRAESAAALRAVPLLADRGRLVRLGDVARLHDTFEEARDHYRIDGRPAVAFTVTRRAGSNALAVSDGVKAAVAGLEDRAPAGVRFLLDADESRAIRAQLTDLRTRAAVAGLVIFLTLLLFLRSVRSAGIVLATIGFSILITVNLLYFVGLTLNVLTLIGLAMGFGLIVDNAIVVLESIFRCRRDGLPPAQAAEAGARQVTLAILAGTLTTVIVLVPFVYLQGELRIYYVPLALAVGASLVASLFVAFTFIPALAARLRTAAPAGGPPRPALAVRGYAAVLRRALHYPWVPVLLAGIVLWGSWRLFDDHVTQGTVWRNWWAERSYIEVHASLPRGEELARTDELARWFEERIARLPHVTRITTRVAADRAHIRVTFPDSLDATPVPLHVKEQLVALGHLFGGAEVRVFGFGPSFYGGGGSPPSYSIRVFGYNYERVREIAEELGRRAQRFARIRDVDTNASSAWFGRDRATEVVVRLDRGRLALHGLTARDAVQQIGAAVQGGGSEALRLGDDEVRFAVKTDSHATRDVQALTQHLLAAPGGRAVRLGDVAVLEEREVPGRIVRENQQYERRVTYEFRGPNALGDRVHEAIMAATLLPAGYRLEGRTEWRWSEEERRQIYLALAFALLLVFMLTAALFESLRQPFCVLLTVPMALVGVFGIFWLTGASFTREAYVGLIMMGGVVVNNAILLVDRVNRLRRDDGLELLDAAHRGTLERARPILMTSSTTVLGLLPLVLFSDAADTNIWNALAYVMVGGLTASTVLVLTVTPGLYVLLERRNRLPVRRLMRLPARLAALRRPASQ